MFCLLVVLVELSVLVKSLAKKSSLRKPNRGEGIVSRKPRPKSAHDFLDLLHCFMVLLCICVVSCPYVIYYPTVMARYSLFVLKVPLNPKQTNKQTILGSRTSGEQQSRQATYHTGSVAAHSARELLHCMVLTSRFDGVEPALSMHTSSLVARNIKRRGR